MPWSGESQGGFSTGTPWLPVDMHGTVDQARQRGDGASMLSLYRALLGLRRAEPALAVGSYSRSRVRTPFSSMSDSTMLENFKSP